MLRGVVRGYALNSADVEDVVQTVWAAAFTHIGRIREPEAIGAWLLVTARREAVRTLQRRRREVLIDDPCFIEGSTTSTPESTLLEAEGQKTLRAAIERLPERQRTLLNCLNEPGLSYADVSGRLSIPIGSIGPTRDQALRRLGLDHGLRGLRAAS